MTHKVLVVVDMQNDFIDGSLKNVAAQAIVPKIADYVSSFKGLIVFTRDTHRENYLETREGKHLPIPHCIVKTEGWQINKEILDAARSNGQARVMIVDKATFSAGTSLSRTIKMACGEYVESIEFCGTCTDICVISNALAMIGEFTASDIIVHKDLCAGLTKEKHNAALEIMRSCQIEVIE